MYSFYLPKFNSNKTIYNILLIISFVNKLSNKHILIDNIPFSTILIDNISVYHIFFYSD
jgi:hypothetical protein